MKWLIYSTQRTYTTEGTEEQAEAERKRQARRHGAVFRKAEDTPGNRDSMSAWKSRHNSRATA